MFIYWGKKRVEKKMGYVSDFCPLCRGISAFQLIRVGVASHLYGIAFGSGELVGHEACCCSCENRKAVDVDRYATLANEKLADLDSLTRTTFPNVGEVYASRLRYEEMIRNKEPLEAADREVFLMEPFKVLAARTEAIFTGSLKIDKRGGLGCLGTVVVFIAVLGIGSAIWKTAESHDQVMTVAWILGIIGFVISVALMAVAPGREFKTKIIPSLVRALKPLDPTEAEVASCIERMKMGGSKLGKKLKIDALWAAIRS